MAEQISEGQPERTPEIVLLGNEESADLTLLDLIDHVLNTGVIIRGNLVLSLAGVDLVYVGLDLIVTSVETAMRHIAKPGSKKASTGRRQLIRRSKL
jgi:Gas vesicle protein